MSSVVSRSLIVKFWGGSVNHSTNRATHFSSGDAVLVLFADRVPSPDSMWPGPALVRSPVEARAVLGPSTPSEEDRVLIMRFSAWINPTNLEVSIKKRDLGLSVVSQGPVSTEGSPRSSTI